eukprot:SAG11_NODE_10_length_27955_cov_15.365235_14_plen_285_part_00
MYQRMVLEDIKANPQSYWFTTILIATEWGPFAMLTGQQRNLMTISKTMARCKLTWAEAESTIDSCQHLIQYVVDRGTKEGVPGFTTAEFITWMNKILWVLVSAQPGVTEAEVMAQLPTVAEMQGFHLGLCKTAPGASMGIFCNGPPVSVALLCEKFERYADAVPWAAAATSEDSSNFGSNDSFAHAEGYRVMGRCLARLGQDAKATAAFEAAIQVGATSGLHLHVLLALSELLSYKLGGERAELMARMKVMVRQLVGSAPTTNQLESLARAQLAGVTLADIMAA